MAKRKWIPSDQPWGSAFLDRVDGKCAARVKPDRDGFAWSIWVGPAGRRVLHNSGVRKTKSSAKTIAAKKLRSCAR